MSRLDVAVVDHGLGNLFSVKRACETVGLTAEITADKKAIANARGLILPGVGAFGDAMNALNQADLVDLLKDQLNAGKPFLGICLGFQLLMEGSDEFGDHSGLGVFKGSVKRFADREVDGRTVKIPRVGWAKISPPNGQKDLESGLLRSFDPSTFMYFVHSYHVSSNEPESDAIARMSSYQGFDYCCSLERNNVCAVQFHPELSGEPGLQIYRHFSEKLDS